MDTRPPIFKEAAEPLDAKEWINTMEDKFHVLRMTKVLKTEYAAHQLKVRQGCGGSTTAPLFLPMPTSLGGSSLKHFMECTSHLV
jgi:hypothetical protein